MKGYKLNKSDKAVIALQKINITGNVIPISWFDHIKKRKGDVYGQDADGNDLAYKKDKVYSNAILLLADIVYWYRPVEIRDEATGQFLGYRKKFKADKLQRSYSAFAEQYGLSKKQVKDALNFLQDKIGVIDLDFRHIEIGIQKLGNVLFIGLNPDRLKQINTPLCTNLTTPIDKFNDTNTETPLETTIKKKPPSGDAEEILGETVIQRSNKSNKLKSMSEKERLLAATGVKKPSPFANYPPDTVPYLEEYSKHFREPYKDECKNGIATDWLRTARIWINRGYTLADLRKAIATAKDDGVSVKRPGSITYAFDAIGESSNTGGRGIGV